MGDSKDGGWSNRLDPWWKAGPLTELGGLGRRNIQGCRNSPQARSCRLHKAPVQTSPARSASRPVCAVAAPARPPPPCPGHSNAPAAWPLPVRSHPCVSRALITLLHRLGSCQLHVSLEAASSQRCHLCTRHLRLELPL